MMIKILLVDDDPSFNSMLSSFLSRNNYQVNTAFSSKSALSIFKSKPFDLVLTDFKLPDMDGLELIKCIKKDKPDLPVILITNYSDIRTAVTSIKLGAYEFVTKPVVPDELLIIIKKALEAKSSTSKNSAKKEAQKTDYVIGSSTASSTFWQHLQLVAPTKMTVLILGESGTGKEYAAKMIHQKSKRANEPFIAVDCGVFSKELAASELFGHTKGAFTGATQDKMGYFELVDKGTIFLDEVGNLPYDVQVQLLRVIQERSIRRIGSNNDVFVDVRIIVATNENLKNAVNKGHFRADLYHRLNEFELEIPPLRERIEDFPEYIALFLSQACAELEKHINEIDDNALTAMKKYSWPGNLRELKNVIKRGVLLSTKTVLTINQLPYELRQENNFEEIDTPLADTKEESITTDLKAIKEQQEKALILKLLIETKYNKSKTAKMLNIDRKTLYHKIAKYKIEA